MEIIAYSGGDKVVDRYLILLLCRHGVSTCCLKFIRDAKYVCDLGKVGKQSGHSDSPEFGERDSFS
jgi:hypothetical protein